MATTATAVVSGIQSLSRALASSPDTGHLSDASLIPLLPSTSRLDTSRGNFRFQYFPETLSSARTPNWQPKTIPGGSLPVYQFVSGGEHTLQFSVQFSCDIDLLANESLYPTLRSDGLKERNPDIRAALAWLRQFTTVTYAQRGASSAPLAQPPKRLLLLMPGTGIGLLAGAPASSASLLPDGMYCIMTDCQITYQAFFPSGLPRLVQVQLSFAQTAQNGDGVQFPGVSDLHASLLTTGRPFHPYQLLTRNTGAR